MISIFLTFVILIAVSYLIKLIGRGKYSSIIFCGLLLRFAILVISYYDILPVPDAHVDADNFHDDAVSCLDGRKENPGNYVLFLSFLYSFTDCSRFFAQFLNLFISVLAVLYLRKILCILDVQDSFSKRIMLFASGMPFINIYSVVLLREAWISFFVTLSLYHFVCWYIYNRNITQHLIISVGGVLAAMWMHAGVIGVITGYFIAFISYNRKNHNIKITKSSYVALLFGILFVFFLIMNMEAFLAKILTSDFIEMVEKRGAGAGGGSDYLTWLDLSNPKMVLLFSPLKMFYFLYSPIILDWRGINDIAAFLLDSAVYIYATWVAVVRKASNSRYQLLKRYLLVSIIATTFIFSLGTSNAGTAIRHRAKTCSVVLVIMALSSPSVSKRCPIKYGSN